MEDPFQSEEKGMGLWSSPRFQMDELNNNVADLMNFDMYSGWCSSPDQMFVYPFSPLQSISGYIGGGFDGLNFSERNASPVLLTCDGDALGSSPGKEERHVLALAERMLRALSMFKESSDGGILAQLWVPVKNGDQYVLSTCEQPFLLDQVLSGYREVSRQFTFSTEVKEGCVLGLPGRVYNSRVPEWTSNVQFYNEPEYLRVQHAVHHQVRGSIALPIFENDLPEASCCAVLELVTLKEKPNFDAEMENICGALQAVNLRSSSPPRISTQCLSTKQIAALSEITDVLRAVCHAHRLPVALTWIPCTFAEEGRVRVRGCNADSGEKSILCIEGTACYVNDKEMQGFVHACMEHYLEEGKGIVGKALKSNHPFFVPDVKEYHVIEYPLVHHARKYCLNAAVAIRLRSTYTGNDDYILELFLPANVKGSTEQQLLLNNLSSTMQRICKSLRTVSESELRVQKSSEFHPQIAFAGKHPSQSLSKRNENSVDDVSLNVSDPNNAYMDAGNCHDQISSGTQRQSDGKRSTSEKHVSLSVLQQYFSGSLKDAAKSIGVCPTTLKRICRQHGISRWPSRKINKVNRSLKKIQTVLDSVQGVGGGLKFDPITGGLVASSSVEDAVVKLEEEYFMETDQCGIGGTTSMFMRSSLGVFPQGLTMDAIGDGIINKMREPNVPNGDNQTSSGMTDSSNGSESMMNGSSSSSRSLVEQKHLKNSSTYGDDRSKLTVKVTYKEDTIRFKFDPSAGCSHLYEEVAQRFEIQIGTFQLKYLDDEQEWVMLVSDADLQECLEIQDFLGTRSMKFLVRDTSGAMGSSGSSSCFLAGSS